jgi:hypothetical protein
LRLYFYGDWDFVSRSWYDTRISTCYIRTTPMSPAIVFVILLASIISFVTISVAMITREVLVKKYNERIKYMIENVADNFRPLHKTICAVKNGSTILTLHVPNRAGFMCSGKLHYTPDVGRWNTSHLFIAIQDYVKFDSYDVDQGLVIIGIS